MAMRAEGGRNANGHIATLDGLRGLAILLVLMFHLFVMDAVAPVDRLFVRVAEFGWCGVDLFFVLSGFLITGILLDTKSQPHYFRNFYVRRALRILPLYYAVVVLALVILPLVPHPKAANFGRIKGDEIWYWMHLCNFSIAKAGAFRHGILDVCWSLAIEEQFYLLWPVIVLLCGRRFLVTVCVGVAVAALAIRLWLRLDGYSPIAVYVLPFCRMDGLAIGGLVAALVRGLSQGVAGLVPTARPVAAVMGLAVLGLVATGDNYDWRAFATQTVGYSALAIFFAAILILAAAAAPRTLLGRWLGSSWMRALGKYSYGLYLFHLPIRAFVRDAIYTPSQFATLWGSPLPGQLLFYIISGGLAFIAAWLSWHLYESRWLALKKYVAYQEPGSGNAAWPRAAS
jgi:peptidoglycan/LPS O-acetylase OafA/YrhL